MTVSTTIIKNFHNGNASTTNFAYQFKILEDTDLLVIIRTNSTGAEATKTLSTHYTVAGAGDASGGSITFTAGNIPASGETVVIRRNVPQTQAIDYIANDPFPAETHEEGLDRGTMVAQQVAEESDRSIKLSRTNTMTSTEFTVGATDRANKVLAFNSSGEISVTQELGTFKGNSATTTTAAFVARDIVKATTTAQLNNIYICVADSAIGDTLTDTDHFALLVDAVSAATSATAAASSASAASTSATAATNNGAAQVTLATAQVALATTQANNSATSATASASSATASANSATASANSATAAAASADAFDDIYLGSKSSDPSTDNDGDALAAGMLYFNTSTDLLRVYTGSAWQNAAVDTTGFITLTGTQTLTNKTLTSPKIGTSILDINGNELAKLTATGSAVNEFTVANAATGGNPILSSTGGDSNIDLDLLAKGTGHVTIRGNTNAGAIQLNCESNSHGQIVKSQPHSAGVTNEMLLPAGASSTLVSLVSTDTLTNKTLTSPKINEDVAVTSTATELNKLDALSRGSILYGNASAATTVLTKGAANTVLKSDGTDLSYSSVTTAMIADDAVTADKLANTAVTAGSYTSSSITVDAQGRLTAASSGSGSANMKTSIFRVGPASGNVVLSPAGTKVQAFLFSGGGGGGAAGNYGIHGGPGGVGGFGFFAGNATGGATLAYSIGAGGAGAPGAYGTPHVGTAGGATTFHNFTVNGGGGGGAGSNGGGPVGPTGSAGTAPGSSGTISSGILFDASNTGTGGNAGGGGGGAGGPGGAWILTNEG
jgi:hypothetical protein